MPRAVSLTLNGKAVRLETDEKRTLLWVLRTDLGLTGTKYGCGVGLCGSCTVVVDGQDLGSLSGGELLRARRHIGMIFQEFNLVNRMSVLTNVLCGRLGALDAVTRVGRLRHRGHAQRRDVGRVRRAGGARTVVGDRHRLS
mgnify:CR=1 FL=1